MKKHLKRLLSMMMAVLLCFGIFPSSAFAKEYEYDGYISMIDHKSRGYSLSSNLPAPFGGYTANKFTELRINDLINFRTAYCIQLGVRVKTGTGYDQSDDYAAFTAGQKSMINTALTLGYNVETGTKYGGSAIDEYIATQILIWLIAHGQLGTGYETQIVNEFTANSPAAKPIFYQLRENVVNYHTIPSFATDDPSAVGAYTHDLKYNESNGKNETTLVDENNVLGNFAVSYPGVDFSVSGNELHVSTSETEFGTITAEKRLPSSVPGVVTGGTKYWLRDEYQNVVTFDVEGSAEPVKCYFSLEIKAGTLQLVKTSEDGEVSGICDMNRSLMLSIDILAVPTDEAVREIQNKLLGVETNAANWQRKQNAANNFSAVLPYDMEQQRKETKEMLEDLTSRDQRMMFGLVALVHLADTKEQLDSDTETLLTTARKHLCQMSVLRWQQKDGLDTALPYGLRRIQALRTLTTESTAVLIPFRAQEILQNGGIYYGQNAVSKNMIVADRRKLLNGNSFRLGVSGSGKSFSAKEEIVSIALSTNDDILILDPESEFGFLVEALGGEVIRVSASSDTHLNAMDMDKAYGDERNPLIEKSEFILSLFEQLVGAGNVSAKEKSILDRCTYDVYREYMANNYEGEPPTLKDLYHSLLKQPEPEARGLALSSELFITGSLNTFAQRTNVDTKARIIAYDIRELGEQLMPIGMLVTLDAIFNRVIQNWKKGKTTWVFADEFYLLFRYEYSADFFYKLWKRIRKYNGLVTGLTQNVEELLRSDTARLMLANSEFLILLNQSATDRDELANLLHISENQLSYITNVAAGCGLIRCAGNIVPFENSFPRNTRLYQLMTTKPDEALRGV